MTQQPSEPIIPVIIDRPNDLKTKVGGSLDASLATKAEQSVQLMAKDFGAWLDEVITALTQTRAALGDKPLTRENTAALYTQALEVKSLGETYGYALITRFAHSLCRLLIRLADNQAAPSLLADAHIDAIKAALRSGMKAADHPVGSVLATELEKQVEAFFKPPGI